MEKRVFLIILILVILSNFASSSSIIEQKRETNTVIVEDYNEAVYKLILNNDQNISSKFRIILPASHWEWIIRTDPSSIELERGERKTVSFYIKPFEIIEHGLYSIPIKIESLDDENYFDEETFDIEVTTFDMAVTTELKQPSEINPSEDNLFKIELTNNYDISYKELSIILESDFFSVSQQINLSNSEKETANFIVNLTGDLREGSYPIFLKVLSDDKEFLNKELEMIIGDHSKISQIGTPIEKLLFFSEKIVKTNDGSTISHEIITKKLSSIEMKVASFTPQPDSIEREGRYYIPTWEFDLSPGESRTIIIEKDYRALISGIIALVIIIGLFYSYKKKHITLTKNILSVKSKDGILSMDVVISLKNKSRRAIKNLKLLDTINHLIEPPTQLAEKRKPRIITSHEKTSLLWHIPKLEGRENYVVSYNVKLEHEKINKLRIPKAAAKYIKMFKRKIVYSNNVKPF
jgi:hypothetical protein